MLVAIPSGGQGTRVGEEAEYHEQRRRARRDFCGPLVAVDSVTHRAGAVHLSEVVRHSLGAGSRKASTFRTFVFRHDSPEARS